VFVSEEIYVTYYDYTGILDYDTGYMWKVRSVNALFSSSWCYSGFRTWPEGPD